MQSGGTGLILACCGLFGAVPAAAAETVTRASTTVEVVPASDDDGDDDGRFDKAAAALRDLRQQALTAQANASTADEKDRANRVVADVAPLIWRMEAYARRRGLAPVGDAAPVAVSGGRAQAPAGGQPVAVAALPREGEPAGQAGGVDWQALRGSLARTRGLAMAEESKAHDRELKDLMLSIARQMNDSDGALAGPLLLPPPSGAAAPAWSAKEEKPER